MGAMSLSHWLIVLVVMLLFFGPKRLGGIGKSLGEGIRGLREGLDAKPDPKLPADSEKKADDHA
jgi:sec-independent protein translocase protein TatA